MSEMGNRRVVSLKDLSASEAGKKEEPAKEEEKIDLAAVMEKLSALDSAKTKATEDSAPSEAGEASEEPSAEEAFTGPTVEDLAEEPMEDEPELQEETEASPIDEPEPAVEPAATDGEDITEGIENKHASLADALAALQKEKEIKKTEEESKLAEQVSSEVGVIAKGTKVLGDIVTNGHLEINGEVQGSINARGNVRVNGDVYGDISCGNLIIKEGVLKINVQAREDIGLGEKARIEGDIRCRKIAAEGTVVGNVVATEMVQVAATAVINGNITAGGIAIGMGAVINGNIKTVK